MSDLLQEIKDYLDSIENNAKNVSFATNYKQAQIYIKTVIDCKEAVLSLFRKLDREYWELREQFEQAQAKAERYEKALKEIIEGEGARLNFIGESNSEALEIAQEALEGSS
jgi:hypothetical protein